MRRFIFSEEVMASFKVGDRVKRVQVVSPEVPIGSVGTVTGAAGFRGRAGYHVAWDGRPELWMDAIWYAYTLAPLTPPAEDAWAADAVRKVTKPRPEFTTLRELLEAR